METLPTLLQDSLLLIWNNRDAAERLVTMEKVYSTEIAFFEGNGSKPFIGYQAISDLIEKLQSDWPSDFEFTLTAPVKSNHDLQQVSWSLGKPGALPVAAGMDIALIAEGKINALYLLFNE